MADSAKARAEARRKAILARGGDRLARITTTARGEEGASYMNDDATIQLPGSTGLSNFVGETTEMPTPPVSNSRNVSGPPLAHSSPFSAAGLGSTNPDPSVWSEEQQQQFMNALIGAAASGHLPAANATLPAEQQQPRSRVPSSSSSTALAFSTAVSSAPPSLPAEDPMAALMSALGGAGAPPGSQFPGATAASAETAQPKPKTLLQKLMPIIHVVSAWVLLAFFVLRKEPELYDEKTHGAGETSLRRWAELGWKSPEDGWGVQAVPFFWAFTTLTLVLHTWRVFTRLDPIQPPMLLALALPHLPPPLPSVITNGLKYLQIGGVLFDDLSALIVGTGFLIWIANLIAT